MFDQDTYSYVKKKKLKKVPKNIVAKLRVFLVPAVPTQENGALITAQKVITLSAPHTTHDTAASK